MGIVLAGQAEPKPDAKIIGASKWEPLTPNYNQGNPTFTDYRKQNHVGMVPDKGFTKQLKTLNKDFEVVWDWGSEKWEIWNFEKGRIPYHVTTIQTQGRSYRELGADILLKLQEGDTTRFTLNELVSYFDEMDDQIERKKRKTFTSRIEAITKETFDYVRGVLKIQVPRKFKVQRVIANG